MKTTKNFQCMKHIHSLIGFTQDITIHCLYICTRLKVQLINSLNQHTECCQVDTVSSHWNNSQLLLRDYWIDKKTVKIVQTSSTTPIFYHLFTDKHSRQIYIYLYIYICTHIHTYIPINTLSFCTKLQEQFHLHDFYKCQRTCDKYIGSENRNSFSTEQFLNHLLALNVPQVFKLN